MMPVLAGAMIVGYLVSALFFLRFWSQTRDRLFALFSAAFCLLALQRAMLLVVPVQDGDAVLPYAVRLLAFLLILGAIVDKNRAHPMGG